MCGIIGYVGHRPAQPVLLTALQRLEYRGYDSCGIALLNHGIKVNKSVGRVQDLRKDLGPCDATIGIGHTRWATHGGVTACNAHPHMDCRNKIAVVHNGVIENFQALKSQLLSEGHDFRSETDTEVIAHLIEKYYDGDIKAAVGRALAQLEGSYALVVACGEYGQLVAARRESPLVVGVGDGENLIASDVSAILDYTDRAIYLEDGDLCTIGPNTLNITNSNVAVSRRTTPVAWTLSEVQKDGYEHFMLKEIHEGHKAIAQTLPKQLSFVGPVRDPRLEAVRQARRIILTACGSSFHAALVGEQLFARLGKVAARAVLASELGTVQPVLDGELVVAITQSGETADVLSAIKKAQVSGCKTLAVVNVPGSTATRVCDYTLFIHAGPEISVAATKTFLAQLTAMYLLALSCSSIPGKTLSRYLEALKFLPTKVDEVLLDEDVIAGHAARLAKYSNAFYVARGINHPIAMEGALKLKEVSYIDRKSVV